MYAPDQARGRHTLQGRGAINPLTTSKQSSLRCGHVGKVSLITLTLRATTDPNNPAHHINPNHCYSIENPTDWLAVGLDEMLPKPYTAADIEELLYEMTSEAPTRKPPEVLFLFFGFTGILSVSSPGKIIAVGHFQITYSHLPLQVAVLPGALSVEL